MKSKSFQILREQLKNSGVIPLQPDRIDSAVLGVGMAVFFADFEEKESKGEGSGFWERSEYIRVTEYIFDVSRVQKALSVIKERTQIILKQNDGEWFDSGKKTVKSGLTSIGIKSRKVKDPDIEAAEALQEIVGAR